MCGIYSIIQINLSMRQKQIHRHKEQACGCQGETKWGRDGLGVWDLQIHTMIYKIDLEGPTI